MDEYIYIPAVRWHANWKSISGPIAGISPHWFEISYFFKGTCEFKPHFWKRMRDDTITVWKQGDIEFDRFYWYLMGI